MEEKLIGIKTENADIALVTALACIAKVHDFISNADIDKFFLLNTAILGFNLYKSAQLNFEFKL